MRMNSKMAITVVGAAFLAACADSPTSPTTTAKVVKPTFIAIGDLAGIGGTPEPGKIKVCKVWEGTSGGSASVTAAVTADRVGTIVNSSPVLTAPNPRTVAAGTCQLMATSTQNGGFDDVSIAEAIPAGAELILDQRFDFTGGAPIENPFANGDAIGFNSVHGSTIVFTNRLLPPPPGNEGCTPGYWKQEQHFGSWAPVALNTTFTSVFGAGIYGGTLLQALGLNGGGTNALIRAGAAAYLNAQNATVDYQYTTAQVIDIVQGDGAYSALSVEARKNLLDAANNGVGGCPLNRDEA